MAPRDPQWFTSHSLVRIQFWLATRNDLMLFLMYFSILGPGKHLAPECIHLEANQLLVQVGVVGRALPGEGHSLELD